MKNFPAGLRTLKTKSGSFTVKKLKIRGLQLLSSNEWGSTFQMWGQTSKKVLLLHRTGGWKSGNHLQGDPPTGKYPKNFLLISGTIKLDAKDLKTGEETSLTIDAPTQIKIYPNLQHTITAVTECCFLEFSLKQSLL